MKFSDIPYARPNLAETETALRALAQKAAGAEDGQALMDLYAQYAALSDETATLSTVASIRHTVDTRDEFYDKENDYFDEQGPVVGEASLAFYRALLASPHKAALEKAYGSIFLEKLALAVQGSDERLVTLQQEENALTTLYEKLYAAARIPFMGKELTVAQIGPYKQNLDRAVRKQAFEAEGGFFDANREELDGIFSRLVRNRTQQAKLLGHQSFTPLGDIRMERLGYTRQDIKACRDAVVKGIVPVVQKLKENQAKRIGLAAEDFRFWDDPVSFATGNPTPKGTPEEILAAGQKMYRALAPETAGFIDFMMEGDLFDVLAKPGKAPGGYCTYIPGYKSPFIFSNFNGTAGDVDVLTHEAGHAFAAYLSAQKQGLPIELRSPGLESCEIHSMAMEFLTAKYHDLFFKQDTAKYAVAHTEDALFFLPYGCQVDEFQETVYDAPHLTDAQRNELWLELERKYRPWNRFEDLPFYARGAGWQRQMHIYVSPFYYIDYVLAQAVALELFLANQQDEADAWQRYLALTEKAGSETYTGLVHAAGLQTPFEEGAMKRVGAGVAAWLAQQSM
ncbi:M3 family oligoendopeptidase [Ruminococcaceae bacterium OttesenSCG-928-O06]|nr:M3 family oligoendopeptidase [Ruminococcaceae bacterium OttesenSCG-928-O06]